MDKDIIIRNATPQDATGISIVQAYTWGTAYKGLMPDSVLERRITGTKANSDRLESIIESGRFKYVVAEYKGAVVGFASYGKSRDENYPHRGEIGALYVLKGFAGCGTGRALFDYSVTKLKQQGYTSMIINCLTGNPSVEFYKHMGGIIAGQRTDRIFDGHTITEDILKFEL